MEKYWQPTKKRGIQIIYLTLLMIFNILSINLELLDKIKNLKKDQRLNSLQF